MDAREQRRLAEENAARKAGERRIASERDERLRKEKSQREHKEYVEGLEKHRSRVEEQVTDALRASDSYDTTVRVGRAINIKRPDGQMMSYGSPNTIIWNADRRRAADAEAEKLRRQGYKAKVEEVTHNVREGFHGSPHGGHYDQDYNATDIIIHISSQDP
jgi:outer membrane translocation and assembly module TamA